MPVKINKLWDQLYSIANDNYAKGLSFEKIQDLLIKEHNDEILIYAIIKKLKSVHYAQVRKEGLTMVGIGCMFILTGFIITFSNFHSNGSITFALYSLTTIGIVVVFWGLYKILG